MQDNLKSIWQRLIRREPACARYESLVSVYADGMASQKEARLVEAHVAACPECRALLASIRVTTGAYADQPAPQMPAGLHERLRLAILQERLLEQKPASIPVRRAPARSLMPRLALAGTFATVIIAAAVVYDLRSSENGQIPGNPAHVAVAPKTGPLSPAIPPASHSVTTAPAKLATASGTADRVGIAPVIKHLRSQTGVERTSTPRVEVAQGADGVRPRATSMINHLEAPQSPQKSNTQIAFKPTPTIGSGDHSPLNHSGVQVARVPSPPATPDVHTDVHPSVPPAVNNPATGEQPTMVAAVPQTQPTTAAPEDNPRLHLARLLRGMADKSSAAALQMPKVTPSEEQPSAEYQPSLAIVGAGLR